MSARRRTVIRVALFALALVSFCNFYHGLNKCLQGGRLRSIFSVFSRQFPSKETQNSLFLDDGQCRATFPGLTKEIDDAVSRGPFLLEKEPDDYMGMVQARIKYGKVRIYHPKSGNPLMKGL